MTKTDKKYGKVLIQHWDKRRFNYGMTRKEIKVMLKQLKISEKDFWIKFGLNTCAFDEASDEVLHYHFDILTALRCVVENRDKYVYEWD